MISSLHTLMCRGVWLVVFVLASVVIVTSQNAGGVKALYVVSCDAVDPCARQTIRRFRFQAGKLVASDVVAEFPTKEGILGHSVSYKTIDNRYFFSARGAVFDTATGTLYEKEVGLFATYDGGKVYIDQFGTGAMMSGQTMAFDLETTKYQRHDRPNFYSMGPGPLSPDHRRIITFNPASNGISIVQKKGKRPSDFSLLGGEGKFTVSCECPYHSVVVPSIWIDNDRFLTQRSNGSLVTFDFRTSKFSNFLTIPLPAKLGVKPRLVRDEDGNILYEADNVYKIDVENQRYTEEVYFGLGHGFKMSGRTDYKLFRAAEKNIGTFISRAARATDGYLAAEYQEVPLKESWPVGVRVWAEATGSWTTIGIKHRPTIVGWINES